MTANLIAGLSSPLKEHHEELQRSNSQLLQQMETLQQELDTLSNRKSVLEDQLSLSQVGFEHIMNYKKYVSESFHVFNICCNHHCA
jgi:cell division protein FtsB